MDYEKKYKEALEIAKNINNEHRAQPFDVMTRVFSELKESEDERIKSAILKALMTDEAIDILVKCSVYYEDVEAWIEKQDKSKFEQCLQDGDKIVTNEDGTHFNVSQLERVAKKEPKKVEDETLVIDEGKAEMDYCFTKMMNGEKVSSAWSEEDENKVTLFMQLTEGCDNEDELADWLKSLKERIKPQWKPGEEQIRTLRWWAEYGASEHIKTLYKELKKLKEK